MPYINVISIRNSVAGCLKYIANPDKTEEQVYLSSLNCSEDISVAEQEFCLTYQHYSHKNFYAPASNNGKSPIKAFHIIQSFKAGECTAETVHKIGLEWVRSVFGNNFQAVICTHTDRNHIHNHICLCPYDLDGIKFNSNKKSLERIRKVSDGICKNYGICEMGKLTSDKNHIPIGVCYGEWKHRKFGTSWKEFIRRKIDYLINNSADLNDLLFQLEQQDFVVKRGKYISVKAHEQQRFVQLKTLGANYSEESISRRILDLRPKIKSLDEIISAAERYFKKYSVFKKSAEYPKSKRQEDKTLLAKYGIKSLDDIEKFRENMQDYSERITALQTQINEIKKKRDDYKSIVETYKNCSKDDYISRLVKAAREKMGRQERAKLKALQEECYSVYFPKTASVCPLNSLQKVLILTIITNMQMVTFLILRVRNCPISLKIFI